MSKQAKDDVKEPPKEEIEKLLDKYAGNYKKYGSKESLA